MATRAKELEMLAGGQGCLAKAADDEPVFILRGQDRYAPEVVERWADLVSLLSNQGDQELVDQRRGKIREARALAHEMRAWQARTGRAKVPD